MMGIFKRKEPRSSPDDSTRNLTLLRPAANVDLISNYSNKSPKLVSTKSCSPTMANSLPAILIPEPPDPTIKPAAYLRSIHAVRERTKLVFEEAKVNALNHFEVDLSKFKDTADYVVAIIKVRLRKTPITCTRGGRLTPPSGISRETMLLSLPMVAGSILRSAEDQG